MANIPDDRVWLVDCCQIDGVNLCPQSYEY